MNTVFLAFGALGPTEIGAIFLVVLLLFGAKKIPELARGVGKGMGEFKKARQEFEREIHSGEEEGANEWEKKIDAPPESPKKAAPEEADESDKDGKD